MAKEIELQDSLENLGAQMVREVASKTSDVAGDGLPPPLSWLRPFTAKGSRPSLPAPIRWL